MVTYTWTFHSVFKSVFPLGSKKTRWDQVREVVYAILGLHFWQKTFLFCIRSLNILSILRNCGIKAPLYFLFYLFLEVLDWHVFFSVLLLAFKPLFRDWLRTALWTDRNPSNPRGLWTMVAIHWQIRRLRHPRDRARKHWCTLVFADRLHILLYFASSCLVWFLFPF